MLEEKLAAAESIKGKIGGRKPEILIILGSGLGGIADNLEDVIRIPYGDIKGFPVPSVKGHKGELICGRMHGVDVLVMQGRFHLYEGYEASVVALVIHAFKLLGISRMIVTNAAGSLNEAFNPGEIMLITDHINFSGRNPMAYPNDDDISDRFFSVSSAYSKEMADDFRRIASALRIKLNEGVYMMVLGPNYETNAEVKAFRILGADAVGMSTVPEILAAASCHMEVCAVSVITNMAAGIEGSVLNHEEVVKMANTAGENLGKIIAEYIREQSGK